MLNLLSRIRDQNFNKITKSPPEQYSISKIKIKKYGEELKTLNQYKYAIIVFDDFLGSSNSRDTDQFFFRSRQNNLDIHLLSQSFFGLPERSIKILVIK